MKGEKMKKKVLVLVSLSAFIIALSGCATARKQKDLEMQGLRNQVSALQTQIQAKDEEINSLRDSLAKIEQEKQVLQSAGKQAISKKVIGEVKSRPNIKQIQIALRNAGFDPGKIDGKMGKQTEEAIRAFQRANNLRDDGRVGKKTWELLREYLYKKVK
jgi:peptidoglycan hydrolase-like protein with peptidoglycan-binding domain